MKTRSTHLVSDEMTASLGGAFSAPAPDGWTEFEPTVYPSAKVKAGLISLTNDPSVEIDFHAFTAPFDNIRVSTHRVYSPQYSNMAALEAVKNDIADAAGALMPDDPLDVIAFGCTSAAMALGSHVVAAEIRTAAPNAKVTDPIASALVALEALSTRRVALLTPYIGEVNVNIADYLEDRDIDVVTRGFFRIYDDDQRNRVSNESFVSAARKLTQGTDCEALFISCTALHTSPIVERLEDEIGIPVVTSNQALVWNVMRMGGHDGTTCGFGKLFSI